MNASECDTCTRSVWFATSLEHGTILLHNVLGVRAQPAGQLLDHVIAPRMVQQYGSLARCSALRLAVCVCVCECVCEKRVCGCVHAQWACHGKLTCVHVNMRLQRPVLSCSRCVGTRAVPERIVCQHACKQASGG
jgi:hypothetical protein